MGCGWRNSRIYQNMTVKSVDQLDISQLDLIFSAVESEAARDIETKMAAELPVVSTSSAL